MMKNSTWKNVLILILIALNIAALGSLWFASGHRMHPGEMPHHPIGPPPGPGGPHAGPGMPDGPPPPARPGLEMLFRSELGFTNDQIAAFEKLKEDHHKEFRDLNRELMQLRESLYGGLDGADDSAADSITARIGQVQQAIESLNFAHFKDIEALCTPDQKDKFIELMKDVGARFQPARPM